MRKATTEPYRNSTFSIIRPPSLILFLGLLLSSAAQAADLVGVVKFARGYVTVESVTGETRSTVKGDNLMQNEVIATGPAGIAVIQLADDSRMTLRPNSKFRVELLKTTESSDNNSGQQSAILNLLRGGLRLVTGLIGRENPAEYRLITTVATIGIRGTEFNTRICTSDCAAEEKKLAGSDAAAAIKEGLYVNVDEGKVFLENEAGDKPLDLNKGESGYVADLNSLPIKLSLVPAFQALDKIPSPSQLDFDDIEISDDSTKESKAEENGEKEGDEEGKSQSGISGIYAVEVEYGSELALGIRSDFFGADPDIAFTLTQEGNKFEGEFAGDRDGTIKGTVDGNKVTFEFLLEAKGGEIKDGLGTWTIQSDGSLVGDFNIKDRRQGIVRGKWTLTPIDSAGSASFTTDLLLILIAFKLMAFLTGLRRRRS